jgi:hypothetical protein
VALLSAGPDADVTVKASAALWSLADSSSANKDAIREAGGIPPLIALLAAGPERKATLKAAGALGSLAFAHANKDAIRAASGVAPLVALLRAGPAKAVTLDGWPVALSNLAVSAEAQEDIAAEGGVPPVVALLAGWRRQGGDVGGCWRAAPSWPKARPASATASTTPRRAAVGVAADSSAASETRGGQRCRAAVAPGAQPAPAVEQY